MSRHRRQHHRRTRKRQQRVRANIVKMIEARRKLAAAVAQTYTFGNFLHELLSK